MGSGPSSTTTQSGQTTTSPWAPAIPYLTNILSQAGGAQLPPTNNQLTALNNLTSQAYSVPSFGAGGSNIVNLMMNYGRGTVPGTSGRVGGAGTIPQQNMISSAANAGAQDITGGVNAANSLAGSSYGTATGMINPTLASAFAPATNSYATTLNALSPYLNANYTNPMAVPGFANTLAAIGQQTQQATDSLFSAAGRDPAGNAQAARAAATATMNAEAPYLTSEYNALAGQQQQAANQIENAGLGTGQLIGGLGLQGAGLQGNLGLGTAGLLGQLGISEGGTLGNLGINAANAITGQQNAQFQTGLEGMAAAEGLPGLYTTPGQAQLSASNAQAGAPIMNLAGLEGLVNPIAGLGGTSIGFGTGLTQGSQSMMGNILGGILGGVGLFGSGGMFPGMLGGLFSR